MFWFIRQSLHSHLPRFIIDSPMLKINVPKSVYNVMLMEGKGGTQLWGQCSSSAIFSAHTLHSSLWFIFKVEFEYLLRRHSETNFNRAKQLDNSKKQTSWSTHTTAWKNLNQLSAEKNNTRHLGQWWFSPGAKNENLWSCCQHTWTKQNPFNSI